MVSIRPSIGPEKITVQLIIQIDYLGELVRRVRGLRQVLHQRARVLQHPLAPQDPPGTASHKICLYMYIINWYRLFCPYVPFNNRLAERYRSSEELYWFM